MTKNKKGKKINKINFYLIILFFIFSFISGYLYQQNKILKSSSSSFQKNDLLNQSDQEILEVITPMAENFIQNFVQGDFIKASQDFNNEMKIDINTQVLEVVQGETLTKIGELVNLNQPKITTKQDNFLFLEYPEAKFSQEEKVSIRIIFKNDTADNLKISGFSFDSPKLNNPSN